MLSLGFWVQEAEPFMDRIWINWLIPGGVSMGLPASAQRTCTTGIRVEGTISDPTGAVIPGAHVQTASGEKTTSDTTGSYTLPCVLAGVGPLI